MLVNNLRKEVVDLCYTKNKRKEYKFTIEYNAEVVYCRQFPEGNKVMMNLLNGVRTPEQEKFLKEVLFDIVKTNKLQEQIINKYL